MILKVFLAVCDLVYTPNRLQTSLAISLLSHGSSTPLKLASGDRKRPASKVNLSTMYESELEITAVTILKFCKCICRKFQLGASRNDSLQMTYSMFSNEYEGERLRVIVGHNSAAAEFAKMNKCLFIRDIVCGQNTRKNTNK